MCSRKTKLNRTRLVGLRLTDAEYDRIATQWQQSTCRKLSEFIRDRLFNRPIITYYRNQSMDDAMAELMQLRTEINHIGHNFNQAVKKLHLLQQIPEFKTWLAANEPVITSLQQQIQKIDSSVQQMGKQWLQ
ncbi:MAG: plasmid mobilization relaxosome protein MobC [Flavipsychrobacter sp.]|nr:plasmid mobilization relaxosome protein MobC [Flavipsychrobacter sp.]